MHAKRRVAKRAAEAVKAWLGQLHLCIQLAVEVASGPEVDDEELSGAMTATTDAKVGWFDVPELVRKASWAD